MNRRNQICTLNLLFQVPPRPQHAVQPACPTRSRLEKGFAYLERLEWERAQGRDPIAGRFMEHRIIWRELLELELQAADEHIERISAAR
jgi:hypothetical protein